MHDLENTTNEQLCDTWAWSHVDWQSELIFCIRPVSDTLSFTLQTLWGPILKVCITEANK